MNISAFTFALSFNGDGGRLEKKTNLRSLQVMHALRLHTVHNHRWKQVNYLHWWSFVCISMGDAKT